MKGRVFRAVLVMAMVVGLTAGTVFAACGPANGVDNGNGIVPPKVLKLGIPSLDIVRLDPTQSAFAESLNFNIQFEGLVGYNYDYSPASALDTDAPMPGLAQSWTHANNYTQWTFTIQEGRRWHDGVEITAADAKFSMEEMLAPRSLAGHLAFWRGLIPDPENDVVVLGTYVVRYNLDKPEPFFDAYMCKLQYQQAAILPKHHIEALWDQYGYEQGWERFGTVDNLGSSPWKLKKLEPGLSLEFEAVRDTEVLAGAPWQAALFDEFHMLSVPEEGTRVAMLSTDELDLIEADATSAAYLEGQGFQVVVVPYCTQIQVGIHGAVYDFGDVEALRDVRVRRALSLAIDREAIAEAIFPGAWDAAVPWAFANQPWTWGVDYDFWKNDYGPVNWSYEPDEARALMAAAGFPDGFSWTVRATTTGTHGAEATAVAEAVAAYWEDELGVTTQVVPIAYDTWRPWVMARPQAPEILGTGFVWGGTGAYVNVGRIHSYMHSQGMMQHTNNPALDAAIEDMLAIVDLEAKEAAFHNVLVMASDEFGWLPIAVTGAQIVLGDAVAELTPIQGSRYTQLVAHLIVPAE